MSNLLENNGRILSIYEGTKLLSISYCNRKLKELADKVILAHNCGYDITMNSYETDSGLKKLKDEISYYSQIRERLMKEHSKVTDDTFIRFITDEMTTKIKESANLNVTVWFSHVDQHTVEVRIKDEIFSTEITFSKKVYDESFEDNEEYDGYLDTARYVCIVKPTSFLEEIVSTMKTNIENQTNRIVSVILLKSSD